MIVDIISGFRKGWYIGYRLFLKSSRSERANSKWGMVWEFAEPITLAAIFFILRQSDVLNFDESEYPFTLFLISGLMPFQMATSCLIRSLTTIQVHSSILDQVNMPPEALFVTNYLSYFFDSSIMYIVLVAAICIFSQLTVMGLIMGFIILQMLGIGTLALGMLLAPINILYEDISKIVMLSIRPVMFLSPIFYSDLDSTILETVNNFNPFAHFLTLFREALLGMDVTSSVSWYVIFGGSLLILVLSILFFHAALPALNRKS